MIALQTLVVIGVVLAVLAAAWLTLEWTNRQPQYGALSLFLWLAALVLFIDTPEIFVRNVGGINIVGTDILCLFLATIAALRVAQHPPALAPQLRVPLILIFGLLGYNYIRGVLMIGLQPATNEFREFFYFLAALGYTVSYPLGKLSERIPPVAMVGGGALVLVALVRIPMMGGLGGLEQRPVPSYAALAMGQAFFFGWAWVAAQAKSPIWRWGVFGFLLMSFLMLHRSVWLAVASGFLLLVLVDNRGRKGLLGVAITAGIVGTICVALFMGDKVLRGLNEAVDEATSGEGSTFVWRLEGWAALLFPDTGWSFADLFFGKPMGSGYARSLGNSVLTSGDIESGIIPHNYYISLILRGGIVGVLSLIALYFGMIKLLFRDMWARLPHRYSTCFIVILATQLIYYVPYSADMIQGVFLGGGIVLASAIWWSRAGRRYAT